MKKKILVSLTTMTASREHLKISVAKLKYKIVRDETNSVNAVWCVCVCMCACIYIYIYIIHTHTYMHVYFEDLQRAVGIDSPYG